MNNLINKKSLEIQTIENIKNSKSNNTNRAYKADYEDFKKFCSKNSLSHKSANPKEISMYLTDLWNKRFKFSTIRRRLVSISYAKKISGYNIDIRHPVISENLKSIKRKIGNYQRGKNPLLLNDLIKIIKIINASDEIKDLKKIRDKTIILLGFAGGFRRSELVSLDYEDIENLTEGLKIFLKKSKTDQFGEGFYKGIPYFKNKEICPVLSLQKWFMISKITNGPIFRKISKSNRLLENRLTDQTIALILKKYIGIAGLDIYKFSGHSLRSGFATVAASKGADERSIMNMTGHKSSAMVRRYIKEANLFKNNALNSIKI